jgi:hypothetical protein
LEVEEGDEDDCDEDDDAAEAAFVAIARAPCEIWDGESEDEPVADCEPAVDAL